MPINLFKQFKKQSPNTKLVKLNTKACKAYIKLKEKEDDPYFVKANRV